MSEIDDGRCWLCGEVRSCILGPEKRPIAVFCAAHARKFVRANKTRRGRVLEFLCGWRYGARGARVLSGALV